MFVIRINVNAHDVKEDVNSVDCNIETDVRLEGYKRVLIAELIAIFESLEERVPELWTAALDEWLKRKGV